MVTAGVDRCGRALGVFLEGRWVGVERLVTDWLWFRRLSSLARLAAARCALASFRLVMRVLLLGTELFVRPLELFLAVGLLARVGVGRLGF